MARKRTTKKTTTSSSRSKAGDEEKRPQDKVDEQEERDASSDQAEPETLPAAADRETPPETAEISSDDASKNGADSDEAEQSSPPKKKRRRGRRGGRRNKSAKPEEAVLDETSAPDQKNASSEEPASSNGDGAESQDPLDDEQPEAAPEKTSASVKKKRPATKKRKAPRKPRGTPKAKKVEPADEQPADEPDTTEEQPPAEKKAPAKTVVATGFGAGIEIDEPSAEADASTEDQTRAEDAKPEEDKDKSATEQPTDQEDEASGRPKKRRRSRGRGRAAKEKAATEKAATEKAATEKAATKKTSPKEKPAPKLGPGREMLINVIPGEECRIAISFDGKLEEIFIERASSESHLGNIYKGRVTNVEPSIQAAFVDFGMNKNGFLHISDLIPQYFPNYNGEPEDIGRKTPHRDRPPIQKCLRRGQEVIVQIIKEGIGTKGPTLNTYISLPGRFLVMMPGMNKLGVSRKIEEDEDRKKMREMLDQLDTPKGMGFILRTGGLNRTKRELQRDLNYLTRLWKTVMSSIKSERAPATLYQESDLAIRTVRDTVDTDIERIIIDDEGTAQKVREFLAIAMPKAAERITVYKETEPLFYRYCIEEEIEKLNDRVVPLPLGGSLVIEQTEALVAIDVNSGKYREQDDAEQTALRTNLEAAGEIARQLRLRDLGGVVVCDFIDMRQERNRRAVEKALREATKRHKERGKILKTSRFGMIEMTRQRTRPSISRSIHRDCPFCKGTGMVKTAESTSLEVMRLLQLAIHRKGVDKIEIRVADDVAHEFQNRKRKAICEMEAETNTTITVKAVPSMGPDQLEIACSDARDRTIKFP